MNKSLKAYNTRCQFVKTVLPPSEVPGLAFFQCFKHQIYRVLEGFIILPDFLGVQELQQGGEVLFLHRCFIVDIGNQSGVEKFLGLLPELIAAFSVTLGICHEGSHQLQNILFAVNVGKGVIVHGFFEIDGVENLDVVAVFQQSVAALNYNAAFSVCLSRT